MTSKSLKFSHCICRWRKDWEEAQLTFYTLKNNALLNIADRCQRVRLFQLFAQLNVNAQIVRTNYQAVGIQREPPLGIIKNICIFLIRNFPVYPHVTLCQIIRICQLLHRWEEWEKCVIGLQNMEDVQISYLGNDIFDYDF